MSDEPEPPRKVYGFKEREFERANPAPAPRAQSVPNTPAPDPGVVATDSGKIDVRELIRTGAGRGPQLGHNAVANRANEVHDVLRTNYQRDAAAGHYELGPLDDSKRRRRIRNYWLTLAAIDLPLGAYAYWIGHTAALPFVCSIAGIAMITATLTWKTFFLRTHY